MVQYLSNQSLFKNRVLFAIILMSAAVVALLSAHGMDVSYILSRFGVPPSDRSILATEIVSVVGYGGAWLASLEFPIIAPAAGYVSYLLIAYGFSVAVGA